MISDFNFTVTSWFLGNFHIKPYFNTQWPPPLHASAIPGWFGLVSCSIIICSQHTVLSESKVQSRFSDQALPRTTDTWWWNICWECFPNSPSINVTCTLKCSFLEQWLWNSAAILSQKLLLYDWYIMCHNIFDHIDTNLSNRIQWCWMICPKSLQK